MITINLTEERIREIQEMLPISLYHKNIKIDVDSLNVDNLNNIKLEFKYPHGNKDVAEELINIFLISLSFKKAYA